MNIFYRMRNYYETRIFSRPDAPVFRGPSMAAHPVAHAALAFALAAAFLCTSSGCGGNESVQITRETGVPPFVTECSPRDGEVGVPVDRLLSVTFSENMEPATMVPAIFTLFAGEIRITGEVSYYVSTRKAFLSPIKPLAPLTLHRARIEPSARSATGAAMKNEFAWSFTTAAASGQTAPVILTVYPAPGASKVPTGSKISVEFNVDMNPTTINAQTFTLTGPSGTVEGAISYSAARKTAYFSPAGPLSPGAAYEATISASVRNTAGTGIVSARIWSFTTSASTTSEPPEVISVEPYAGARGVSVNQTIKAFFGADMDPTTIGTNSLKLSSATETVKGTVTYSQETRTATFAPATTLARGILYTATLSATIKSAAGISLTNDHTWYFTTENDADVVSGDHPANPIFDPVEQAYYPCIIRDGTTYRMWYDDGQRTRYTTSHNGIDWKEGSLVTGLFSYCRHPKVERVENGYMIWYWNTDFSDSISVLRCAESVDGINWTNDAPLTQVETTVIAPGKWNHESTGICRVFFNPDGPNHIVVPTNAQAVWQNRFVMYYFSANSVGLAASADGRQWQGYDDGAQPVIAPGETGSWDNGGVIAWTVMKIDNTYHMWYSGGKAASNEGIGHAQSPDGVIWIKSINNPILHKDNGISWRNARTYTPSVIYEPGEGNTPPFFKMWYSGLSDAGAYSLGFATLKFPGDQLKNQ